MLANMYSGGGAFAEMTVGPPRWQDKERAWLITRYADVALLLKSEAVGLVEVARELEKLSARLGGDALASLILLLGTSHPFQNAPAHEATRAVLKEMMARVTRRWTPQAMARLVGDMLIPLMSAPFDAVPAVAAALPATIIADTLGLSIDQVRLCGALTRDISTIWHQDVTPLRTLRTMEERAARVIELLHETGQRRETFARLAFLTMAGVDTTSGLIGNALDILAADPALQARLNAEPARISGFVNETLRFRPPLRRLVGRRTLAEVRLAGGEIPAGRNLIIDLDSAHRDPEAYPDPDRFDMERAGAPVLAFGFGVHSCVGAALARMEARVLIEQLVADLVIHHAGDAARGDSPDWNDFMSLPLRLERRLQDGRGSGQG